MADLLIRAAMNDHNVIGDLLAPGAGPRLAPRRQLIHQLVADAHVAEARPVLADHARAAGIPFVVDPDTVLLQSLVAHDNRWVKLPYGVAEAMPHTEISMKSLVESVVEFELDKGATVIIPPYFYAASTQDPWFHLTISAVNQTSTYLSNNSIRLPLMPVLCAQLQAFSQPMAWASGIDRFSACALDAGAMSAALYLSPSGAGDDGYGKVMRLFEVSRRAKRGGLHVVAWRQGIYGPALVAAGLAGYECGLGTGEQTNVSRRQASRKPSNKESKQGGGGTGIFIETLGRSVSRSIGNVVFGNPSMKPKVLCDDESCCSSAIATLDQSRHHAARARARLLREISDQPHSSWRLNHVARQASSAATLAVQINRLLAAQGEKERLKFRNLEALAHVAHHLSESDSESRSA